MTNVFKKALILLTGDHATTIRKPQRLGGLSERELIQLESQIGGELFGPVPADHRRDFFCLDKNTWIWHEEWTDIDSGAPVMVTTRYEVHDNGILKAQEGKQYHFLEGDELNNLYVAIRMYYEEVAQRVYGRDPRTGLKLA